MQAKTHCQRKTKDPIIPLREPKTRSQLVISNPDRDEITIIKVDGCEIVDNATPRCDFAIDPHTDLEIYVELKGSDVKHAIEQLESTISIISSNPKLARKLCIVVSTRVPRQGTNIQTLQRRFMLRYRATLRIKNGKDLLDLSATK
jgi:hypothetical protein